MGNVGLTYVNDDKVGKEYVGAERLENLNYSGIDRLKKVQPKSAFVFFNDRFVFDRASGMFFAVSKEAALILRSAWERLDRDDIRKLLMQRFDIERGTAIRDMEQFLGKLKELDLLPPTWSDRT